MAIEDLLREAAAKGMTHLSLYPVWSSDGKTTYWNASASPSTQHHYVKAANYDPVVALTTVLEALPRAPKRKQKAPASEKEITAAVKEPIEGGPFRGVDQTTFKETSEAANEWERFKV